MVFKTQRQLPALRCPALQCLSSWQQQCSSCLTLPPAMLMDAPVLTRLSSSVATNAQFSSSTQFLFSLFHLLVSSPRPPVVGAVSKWLCGVWLLAGAEPRHPCGFIKKRKSTGSYVFHSWPAARTTMLQMHMAKGFLFPNKSWTVWWRVKASSSCADTVFMSLMLQVKNPMARWSGDCCGSTAKNQA